MAKWPRYGYGKTRLAKDIGKKNALKIQQKMLSHTLSVSNFLTENEIVETSLAFTGIGFQRSKRLCKKGGIKTFYSQGRGCLGEKMKRQIVLHKRKTIKNTKRDFIIIGTDLPDLCHMDISNAISKLKFNDVVLGPSNDGGYWLIAFSKKYNYKNISVPFLDISWSQKNVLKKTVDNLRDKKIKIDLLDTRVDIDSILDIYERK